MKNQYSVQNPDYLDAVKEIFTAANFIAHLGAELVDMGPGWCESKLDVRPEHLQQHDFVHGGIIATIADHTAGASAGTLSPAEKIVLTVEYKINFLRPGQGQRLRCRAEVLKAGKTITVSE